MKKNDASRKALRIIGSILVAIALWIYVDTVTSPEVTLKVKKCASGILRRGYHTGRSWSDAAVGL